jgi:hypothetical protein
MSEPQPPRHPPTLSWTTGQPAQLCLHDTEKLDRDGRLVCTACGIALDET